MLKLKDVSTEDFCRALTNPQQFLPERKGAWEKPKMKIDNEVFIDLLGRAGAVSPECKSKITDMAAQGGTEYELLRGIADIACGKEVATTKRQRTAVTSFEGVEDADFFAGLTRPSLAF